MEGRRKRSPIVVEPAVSVKMEEDLGEVSERILRLTLEIIYTVTGEVRAARSGWLGVPDDISRMCSVGFQYGGHTPSDLHLP